MLFSELSIYLEKLEKTSSRLEITRILAELFKKTDSSEIDKVVYLSLGTLAPNYESIILNLAEKMVIRALALAHDKDIQEVTKLYKEKGDLGNVAQELAQFTVHRSPFTVSDVYEKLVDIASDNGEGSQDRKILKFSELIKNLDPLSARFVTRIPIGKLRLGFSEKTVLDALGVDESGYNIHPDIGFIAKFVKQHKIDEISPKVGVPVVPMLPQRLNSPAEMIKKMGEVSVEPKYDGLRIFIHFRRKDNFIWIFTRNMNAIDINTFPELFII
ncbi:MAG TPA: DNA ligase, partial [Alphaproteobacteria bacterium]|nr:DNA ligase [Alphaproteobacteria bacterium]